MGKIGILNVGAGDIKLSFDPDNPADAIRAARIVAEMLKRGYALLVDTGRKGPDGKQIFKRARAFDEKTHEYIIADYDPTVGDQNVTESTATPSGRAPAKKGRPTKRVAAHSVDAVAVARTAGG